MKSSLRSDEIQDMSWMKSNPSKYNPAKQDFIRHRWISPVEDGFDCVFSVKDNTLMPGGFFYLFFFSSLFLVKNSESNARPSSSITPLTISGLWFNG